jgi:hypothetical protein
MEKKNLGQLIGQLIDHFSITNDDGDTVQLTLTFDFSTSSDAEIKSWLCGNRRIAYQRPARAMSKDELTDMNNTVIMANEAGRKVKSKAEKVAAYMAMGIPEDVAIMAVDNPMAFKKAMDNLGIENMANIGSGVKETEEIEDMGEKSSGLPPRSEVPLEFE